MSAPVTTENPNPQLNQLCIKHVNVFDAVQKVGSCRLPLGAAR